VGERIVTSPDAPVGVGAVGKLSMVGGRPTMKMARGSGKATLPGEIQVFRDAAGQDVVACADEQLDGEPLLAPVWRGDAALVQPSAQETRETVRRWWKRLPAAAPRFVSVRVSDRLAHRVEGMVRR
jgi:nicotinic acid phosphoribosyltransferase